MFEKLILKNFQRHKNLEVDLNHPVTTIIGPNDRGKTSIIRALKWIMFNRPQGEEFKRNWKGTVRAELQVDGHTIVRKRGKENLYILDGAKLKSFSTGVPDPVSNLLNVTEDNLQEQLDSPFWFCLSAGQVSKELNKIVDLEIIDETLKTLATKTRTLKTSFDISTQRITQLKAEIKELKWVESAVADLQDLNNLEEKTTIQEDEINFIQKKQTQLKELTTTLGNIDKAIKQSKEISELAAKCEKDKKEIDIIQSKLDEVEVYKTQMIQNTTMYDQKHEQLDKALKGRCPLCGRK